MKRFLLFFTIGLLVLFVQASPVSAATTVRCYTAQLKMGPEQPNDPINGKEFCQAQDGKTCADPPPSTLEPAYTWTCIDKEPSLKLPTELLQTTKDCTFNIASADPCVVQQNTFVVRANIQNIPLAADGTTNYFYCLKAINRDCDNGDLKDAQGTQSSNGKTGSFTLAVCGDGKDKLTTTKCDIDGSDWFWAGSTYRIHVYDKRNAALGNNIASASFSVTHIYPEVIEPKPGTVPNLNANNKSAFIPIKLRDIPRPKGGNASNNVFWVQAQGGDGYYSPIICVYPAAIDPIQLPLPLVSDGVPLVPGGYKIIIKESSDAPKKSDSKAVCIEGKFTLYHIPFLVGNENQPGEIGPAIPDPLGWETAKQLNKLPATPICTNKDKKTGYCLSIPTPLGEIHTDPRLFVRDIFTILLSIGGIAAIIFFIQAGYTLMTSAGNKEKIGAAREQITAAIMGLIFIILSITILEFIGINILHIPGFGN